MINIETKNDKFTAFGGLAYVFNALSRSGLAKLFDNHLGKMGERSSSYSYASVLKALVAVYFSGGDCIEDVNGLRDFWGRDERMPSADVVGRAMKELSVASRKYISKQGGEYRFNTAEKMNSLLVKSARTLGLLGGHGELVVDYDNLLIATEKKDATYSYKQCFGYFPGVLAVGGVIDNRQTPRMGTTQQNRPTPLFYIFCKTQSNRHLHGDILKTRQRGASPSVVFILQNHPYLPSPLLLNC